MFETIQRPTTRRDLLGAPKPEALPLQHDAGTEPDAELIALCSRFNSLERQIIASYGMLGDKLEDEEDALREPLQEAQKPLLEQIMGLRATTIEGHRARAAMFRLWYDPLEGEGRPDGNWAGRLAWALVRDVLGEAA